MTSKRIAQTNQQQDSEVPQGSGILQRAAIRSVSDAGVLSADDREAQPLGNSALSKDFSRVPISTKKPQQIMTKLMIGPVGDKYEQEADRVAAQVVQRINAPASVRSGEDETVQREEMETKDNEAKLMRSPILQRKSNDAGMAATPDLEASIHQARSGGQPMADNIRQPMEKAFGADFSGVKVHTDSRADQLNQSIQAKAFTTGQDVFFRQGAYDQGSGGGQELLAHELTHVVQQSRGAQQREKIQSKTEGSIASTVLKKNGATIQTATQNDEDVSPNRVGIEQELASIQITIAPPLTEDKKIRLMKNGVKLAETEEKTFKGLPVLKLETEQFGQVGPNSAIIELIYGPLEMKDYKPDGSLDKAIKKMIENLKVGITLEQAIQNYNSALTGERYKLTPTADAKAYNIKKKGSTLKYNQQTNVAIPYSKLGQISKDGVLGFEGMFGSKDTQSRLMYEKGRVEAAQIIRRMMGESTLDVRNLQSQLTHIIYQEAMFKYHNIDDKKNIKKEKKHHFHVMLKLSPEDAVVSILSDQELEVYRNWWKTGDEELINAVVVAHSAASAAGERVAKVRAAVTTNVKQLKEQLEIAIGARMAGAITLQLVSSDEEGSVGLDQDNLEIKDENEESMKIRHTHPRPTNRIPVYKSSGEHYMVVEQRSAKHLFNEMVGATHRLARFQEIEEQVKKIQKV